MKSIQSTILNIATLLILCTPALGWSQSINLSSMFDSDNRQADTYRRSDAMMEGTADTCKVIQSRQVNLEAGNTAKAVATSGGAIIGAAAGNRSNANNYGGVTAESAIGGIIGAVAGNYLAQKVAASKGHEYFLACAGRTKTIVQEDDGSLPAPKGSEVYVVVHNGRTRVVY